MKFLPGFKLCCGASAVVSTAESSVNLSQNQRLVRRHSSTGQWKPSLSMISEDSVDLSANDDRRIRRGGSKKLLHKSKSAITVGDYYWKSQASPTLSFQSSLTFPYMF